MEGYAIYNDLILLRSFIIYNAISFDSHASGFRYLMCGLQELENGCGNISWFQEASFGLICQQDRQLQERFQGVLCKVHAAHLSRALFGLFHLCFFFGSHLQEKIPLPRPLVVGIVGPSV